MRGSWTLGRLLGIEVKIHFTFALLLALLAGAHLWAGGPAAMATGLLFTLAIFGSVLLHEFGHALAARRFGVATRDITLLPIGGVAALEGMPRRPLAEAAIALAGPAVNVAIAAVLGAALWLAGALEPVSALGLTAGPFAERLLLANLGLALFNLLPAFPLDGGRVLRALLAWRLGYSTATRWAARIGRGLAVVLGAVGVVGNPMLVLVAVFVWFAAGAERRSVELVDALGDARAARLAARVLPALSPADRLAVAAQAFLVHGARALPVAGPAGAEAALLREDLLDGLARLGPGARVEALPMVELTWAPRGAPLVELLPRLGRAGLAVVCDDGGAQLGYVTAEQILLFASVAESGRAHEERWAGPLAARAAEEA